MAFTFTFGEDSMLSSAEAIIKFGPMRKLFYDTAVKIFNDVNFLNAIP